MITYDTDGITLIDGNGRRVGPREDAYYHLLAVRDAQLAATGDNNAAGFKYHTDLATFQGALDAGRAVGLSSPAKPQMRTVSDDGVVSIGPFAPPLPDAVYPTISPSTGSGKSAPQPDRTDAMMNIMIAVSNKVDRLLAK